VHYGQLTEWNSLSVEDIFVWEYLQGRFYLDDDVIDDNFTDMYYFCIYKSWFLETFESDVSEVVNICHLANCIYWRC
jgi:hypothetical protein